MALSGIRRLPRVAVVVTLAAVMSLVTSGCLAAAGDVATGRAGRSVDTRAETEAYSPFTTVKELGIDDVFRPVATLGELKLENGEVRFLEGTLAATSSEGALQQIQIRCTDGAGEVVEKSTVSGRNTSNNRHAITTVTVRWLFRAPTDGSWYCALFGMGHKENGSNGVLTVEPGTELVVADDDVKNGVQWFVVRDKEINSGAWAEFANRPYELDSGTQYVDIFASMHVTNNYSGRESNYDSLVTTTARLTQLDSASEDCGQTWVATSTQRVTPEVHHDDVAVIQRGIPIRAERECGELVRLQITVKVEEGSPVTVHGPAMTDQGPGSPYGNYGILMHY